MADDRIAIPGSTVSRSGAVLRTRAADPNQTIEATIVIRRANSSANQTQDLLSGRPSGKTRDEIEQELAATPADLKAVTDFAHQQGLTVVDQSAAKRTVRLRGTAAQMNAAFGIQLAEFEHPGGASYLSYDGSLTVPQQLSSIITAVLGLHQEPAARSR